MAVGTDTRLLDDLPVAVAVVGDDATIRYVNPAAVARYGWRSAESPVGLSAAVLGEGLAERITGHAWRGELPATSAEGMFIGAFEVAPMHDEDGDVAGSLVVCLDASRRADAERAADRLSRLQAVTARLGGAATIDEVALAVCDRTRAGVGAGSSACWAIVDEGATLERIGHVGSTSGDGAVTRVALTAATAAVGRLAVQSFADSFAVQLGVGEERRSIAAVNADPRLEELMVAMLPSEVGARTRAYLDELVEGGRSILSPSLDPAVWDDLLGDRTTAESVRALDVASAIVVGLHSGGRRLGVLSVTRRAGRPPFDQDAFVLVAELAGRLASAIDGALAHQSRAEVARLLQASLLPPRLPEIPGVALAARYDPVGDGSLVGGDFYDVFPVDGHRWCLVLGDVCGQGVAAASLTSLVRYTIRAAAHMWTSPAAVLRFTNEAMYQHDIGERFCTVLLAMLTPGPRGLGVQLAVGGHHLPMHRRSSGESTPVGRPGTALGLVREPDLSDTALLLGVGDLLVLTTDGVIEARDGDGRAVADDFLETVVAEHAERGADGLAGAVEEAVLRHGGGRTNDDVAVLVLEVTGASPATAAPTPDVDMGPFGARYPLATVSVTEARRALAGWLDAQGIPGSRVPDLLVAVTELATNGIRAARTAIEVRAWLTTDAVMVEVTDDGIGFDPAVARTALDIDPLAERGRGLFLVAALVDECTIESTTNGTVVRCYLAR